jgi:uncharacterized membrane protein YoaK (UPF0700 family)
LTTGDTVDPAESRSSACLLTLAVPAGAVDASNYLGLGRVFTANMTGNTVLLGVALARGSGADAARSVAALGGFCAGGAIGTLLVPTDAWVTYAAGAIVGAFAVKIWHTGAIAIPLAIVCAVGVMAFRDTREER